MLFFFFFFSFSLLVKVKEILEQITYFLFRCLLVSSFPVADILSFYILSEVILSSASSLR